jgi:YD repeat-containing protein
MKTSFSPRAVAAANDRRVISATALITLFVALASVSVFAQGGDNPTGVYGAFNVRSTTGGSFDPYTGNATRTIPDITVAGAVGAYPLQWSRTMNSRAGASWRHSYAWSCTATSASTNIPNQYTVSYPDGRVIKFTTGGSVGVPYKGPTGIGDRFQAAQGDNVDCFLLLADGGKVKFRQHASFDSENNPPWEFSVDPPTQITDPNSLSTTLAYDSVTGRLTQVTEPAGRWLKIYYRTDTGYVGLIDHVNAGYGAGSGTLTQTVTYTWEPYNVYKVLKNATYSDNIPGSYDDVAAYTYKNSNVTGSTTPLLSTCRDTRYPGPMKNISYDYVPGGAFGVLLGENHFNADGTSTRVVTLAINTTANTRTETRPGGTVPTRTFYYGANAGTYYKAYLLLKQTDFLAKTTNYTYNAAGFLNSVKDANLNTTSFTRLATTGAITQISHPGDGSYITYAYEDPTTGYYLKSVTDELFRTTTYLHGNTTTMTTSEINYPDGGVEKFTYNGYNQILTHTFPANTSGGSTGGTETYDYDTGGRGLLIKYTPPTGTNNPTFYSYNINDHLSTITDPGGNVTTLYHDQVGRLTIVQYPGTASSDVDVGFVYNPDGTLQYQVIKQNAAVDVETDYTYDDYKRLKTMVRPMRNAADTGARTTKFWYDVNGTADDYTHTDANPTFVTTPAGVDVVNVYDKNFRKLSSTVGDTSRTDSTPATTSWTYDPAGNLKTLQDPNGQTWTYNYDVRNRLINVINPLVADRNSLGHTIDYTYDVASNKKTERRANDQLITYDTYDAMNRLTKMTVPQTASLNAVTSYTWTKAGKLDLMTDPRLKVYNYDYDTLNRLTKLTFPTDGGGMSRAEVRTYDAAGNLYSFKNRADDTQTFPVADLPGAGMT